MSKISYTDYDAWNKFSYESRYLDALASLFHVQTDVIAAIELKNEIYLSYNSDLTKMNNLRVSLISNIVKKANLYCPEDFLGIYLLFNMDFIALVGKTRNHVDIEANEILEEFRTTNKDYKGSIDRNIKKINSIEDLRKYTVEIVKVYNKIIDTFVDNNDLNIHLNTFIRPLQDSYKLYNFLVKDNKYQDIKDILVLDNPNNIHADSNVAYYFSNGEYLDNKYMGVSKLCCGYCHKYLDKGDYLHRGTHGVCDDKWKMPWPKNGEIAPHEQNFKDSTKSIAEFDQFNPPQQHRRLSIDTFEQKILINKEKSLWDLKIKIGFIKKSKPVKVEQKMSLIEEIIDEPNIGHNHFDPNVLKVIGGGNEQWEVNDDFYC